MKKLIPALLELSPNNGMRISDMKIDNTYIVSVSVNMPNKGEVKVGVLNLTLFKKNGDTLHDMGMKKQMSPDHEILPDLRDKIIDNVKDLIRASKSAKQVYPKPIESINDFLEEAKEEQDARLERYISQANLTKSDSQDLHRFFSPLRIPAGLTNKDIHRCIFALPLRIQQKEFYPVMSLPVLELLAENIDEDISRTDAVLKSIAWISEDIKRFGLQMSDN